MAKTAKNLTRNMEIPSIAGLFVQSFKKFGLALSLRNLWKFGDFRVGDIRGSDQFGNTYWEGMTWVGPKRWVEYRSYWYDPSEVPPEWHSWLHSCSDDSGEKVAENQPIYRLQHKPNNSADSPYSPHNFLLNEDYGRNTKKIQSFQENLKDRIE